MNYLKIGAQLKLIRERKGLSLHQVFEVTRIQVSILRDIEEGSAKVAPVVLKSFIKTYCRFLALDFKKLERDLEEQALDEEQDTENNNKSLNSTGEIALNRRYKYLFPIFGLSLIFLLLFFLDFPKKFFQIENKPEIDSQTSSSEKKDKALTIETMKPDNTVESIDSFFELKSLFEKIKQSSFKQDVLIQSSEQLNIYFKADNRLAVNKILKPFSWYYIKARESLYLRIDNKPMGIQLFHNGEQLDLGSNDFFEKKFE